MPRKLRELLSELVRAGFIDRGGKGSHRYLAHPGGARVTLAGKAGDDAKAYQERAVAKAIRDAESA